MNWNSELWDQYESVSTHTQRGIEWLEKYGHFVEQLTKIETEYATKLRRLVKSSQPKRKHDDASQPSYTYMKAFQMILSELSDQAGQHEFVAENLSSTVVTSIAAQVKALKDDRRKCLADGNRVQQQLQASLQALSKSRDRYEKAFMASIRASDNFRKADDDLNLSRAEVEKHRLHAQLKSRSAEEAKNEYAAQLQRTNQFQSAYYSQLLAAVLSDLQALDQRRVMQTKTEYGRLATIQSQVVPILGQCADGMQTAADAVDVQADLDSVVDQFKSGFRPPDDIPFEDLSQPTAVRVDVGDGAQTNGVAETKAHNSDGTPNGKRNTMATSTFSLLDSFSSTSGKHKLMSLFTTSLSAKEGPVHANGGHGGADHHDGFADLPPSQRRKRIVAKIDELTHKLNHETATRDGLTKMKEVYEANPTMGDPASLDAQFIENDKAIETLRSDLEKFQAFLSDVNSMIGTTAAASAELAQSAIHGGGSPSNSVYSGNSGVGSSSNLIMNSVRNSKRRLKHAASKITEKSKSSSSSQTASDKESVCSDTASNVGSNGKSASIVSSSDPNTTANTATDGRSVTFAEEVRTSSPPAKPLPKRSDHPQQTWNRRSTIIGGVSASLMPSAKVVGEWDAVLPSDAIGSCQALYVYAATTDGSISMAEAERFWLLEEDQGDGWSRVRRLSVELSDTPSDGFVPTAYLRRLKTK